MCSSLYCLLPVQPMYHVTVGSSQPNHSESNKVTVLSSSHFRNTRSNFRIPPLYASLLTQSLMPLRQLPDIIEWLAGSTLTFVLFLLQITMVQRIQLLASGITICDDTVMRFIFQFVVLHLQLQGFSTFASPTIWACDTRVSLFVGGVWEQDYSVPLKCSVLHKTTTKSKVSYGRDTPHNQTEILYHL